jgi:hypothetical protein
MTKDGICGKRLSESGVSRRRALEQTALGFGKLAALSLLANSSQAIQAMPGLPHFVPRAKRVLFLFMHGGPSHLDTFDYKPLLVRD